MFYTAVGLITVSVIGIALCSVIIVVYTAQNYEQFTICSKMWIKGLNEGKYGSEEETSDELKRSYSLDQETARASRVSEVLG